ncbi:insulinase family protein [Marinomonas pollencensis]|uniref:Protease 3 n=1 Tax=Marinomonas pollencensis TaxID=491954 RepID=A0A3E0DQP8_9GAMM|nr:insulinase family protein [Marinomonas pollencensis]REG84211.1 secreted Zn-dependent insulinase-like peptidase [Marinomonas pollencensis]
MKTLFKALVSSLLCTLILNGNFALADTPTSRILTPLDKAITDHNTYRLTTLKNGLNIILVNDPHAERFAASMAVNVGSYQDPKNQQGLAHFLEHMLLLGSKKYPEAGSYQSFISRHGGSYNAYTSINSTNFFFDVEGTHYRAALDRFSQLFIDPLLSADSAQREKNAVNAEYKAKFNSQRRRLNQAFKTLFNPEHPQSQFTVGSLDTLKDRPGNPLRTQLLTLYKENYVANNMALVLIANLPIAQLDELATKYFSAIPSGNVKPRPEASSLLKPGAPQLQFTRPEIDSNTLSFCYQIDSQEKNYHTTPTRYLSYILGNESKGSLYAKLKDAGYINSLSSSVSPDYQHNALFCTDIRLTKEGVQHIDDVAKSFFATIETIKLSPINPIYLKEEVTLSQLTYDYHNYIPPQSLAKLLSSRMLSVPPKDALNSFKTSQMASNQEIQDILQQLTDKNLVVQVASPHPLPKNWSKTPIKWQLEPWYQSKYSNNQFSQTFLNMVHYATKSVHVTLPKKNPFIPTSFSMIDEQDQKPHIIYQKKDFTFWHKADASFQKPTAINFLSIRFDQAANTAKNSILNHLWTRTVNASISESTYEPYIAGLGYSLYPHLNGISFNTTGYADKQGDYLIWLVDQLFLFRPTLQDFQRAKAQLKQDLENQKSRQAYQGANTALNTLITKNSFTTKELLEALDKSSIVDLQKHIKKAKSHFDIVGYSTGDISEKNALKLANTLHERVANKLTPHLSTKIETKQLTAQARLEHRFPSISQDSTVLYALLDTGPQAEKKSEFQASLQMSYFAILCNILNSRFYNQLRTEQQMGYIVGVQDLSTRNTPILGFVIQSPDKDTTTLVHAIENFIKTQAVLLQTLPQSDFQYAKNNLISTLSKKPRNLDDNAYDEWHEIAKQKQNFDHKKQAVEVAKSITQAGFIEYIKQKIENGNTAKILIHNKKLDKQLKQKGHWVKAHPEGNNLILNKAPSKEQVAQVLATD